MSTKTETGVVALAQCAMNTLCMFGRQQRKMVWDRKKGQVSFWQSAYFDALDAVGIVVDREAYFASITDKKAGITLKLVNKEKNAPKAKKRVKTPKKVVPKAGAKLSRR